MAKLRPYVMIHPACATELAHAAMRDAHPSAASYQHLQREGSAWSRGSAYGDLAVEYAMEAAVWVAKICGPGASVCCAGCNDGLEMETFKRAGMRVQGFDLDPEKVRVAAYCGLLAIVGDIHEPPYAPSSFDSVFCSHTLEHCLDRTKAAKALLELVRPGGIVFLVVPIEPAHPFYNPSHTGWIASPDALRALFADADVLEAKKYMKPDEHAAVVFQRRGSKKLVCVSHDMPNCPCGGPWQFSDKP